MTDWHREYLGLTKALWAAYSTYKSAVVSSSSIDRYFLPVIKDARKKLKDAEESECVYAIGYDNGGGSHGMVWGPSPNIEECLAYTPHSENPDLPDRPCEIIEFRGGLSGRVNRVVARWDPKAEIWEPVVE